MTDEEKKERPHLLKKDELKLMALVFTAGFLGALTLDNQLLAIALGLITAGLWGAVWKRSE